MFLYINYVCGLYYTITTYCITRLIHINYQLSKRSPLLILSACPMLHFILLTDPYKKELYPDIFVKNPG